MSVTEDLPADALALAAPPAGEALPPVFDLLTQAFEDLRDHFVGYLLAGLGLTVVLLPVVILGMGLLFVGMVPGIALGSEGLTFLGMTGGLFAYVVLLIAVNGPLNASMMRALWHHQRDGEPLSFGSVFRYMRQDLGAVLAYSLLQGALVTVGLMMCFVPALAVGLFTAIGLPAIAIHRLGAIDALKRSVGHVREHLSWHLGFWALGVGILIVAQNIPVIGMLIGVPFYSAYLVAGYGRLFPEA